MSISTFVLSAEARNTFWKALRRILLLTLILTSSSAAVIAQNSFERGIPAESKPGQSTVSAYAMDKIEAVNLANGNMALHIPLVMIGGRGSASYGLALSYNSKLWSAQRDHVIGDLDPFGAPMPAYDNYYAFYDNESMTRPGILALGGGWTLATGPALRVRRIYINPHGCTAGPFYDDICYDYVLTRMWLLLPDGGEVELRDQLTDGAPYYSPSNYQNPWLADRDRGRVWHSTDGSAITYISDANNGGVNGQLSGWVFLSDGTRLKMQGYDAGYVASCSRIIDRNDNFITIDYGVANPGSITYTDQVGRQVLLQSDGANTTLIIKGYAGISDRVISITSEMIGAADGSGILNNLRANFRSYPRPFVNDYLRTRDYNVEHTVTGPHTDLFAGAEGGENIDEKYMVTRLNLLDGRSMRFRYNPWGEVAEIVYPGGGTSQIDYQGFQTTMCEAVTPFSDVFDRRVTERRALTDGSTVDATWTYDTKGSGQVGGVNYPTATVEAHQGTREGTLLASEKQFFLAVNAEYRYCVPNFHLFNNGTGNERWDNAKVFRIERQTGVGTRVVTREWQQRTPVSWNGYTPYAQEQAANDPRVVWEETTLENGKKQRTEYGYDDFNNVTSVKEYDFGDTSGSTGPLLRQTFRTYATALNGYCYSNLNGFDSSCGGALAGDVNGIIHQRRLLLNETVKDGAGNQKAYTEFEYDSYAGTNHAAIISNAGMIQYDGVRFSLFSSANHPRGNVTKVARWAGGSNYLYAYSHYDNAGNVILTKDPKGYETTISYADNFGSAGNPDSGAAGANGATFAFATLITNPLGHQAKTQFDYTHGVPTSAKDPNGVISKTEYDLLGRPTRAIAALSLGEQAIAETTYPTATSNEARASGQLDATRWLASKTVFDGFDRPISSWQAEDGLHSSTANFTIRVNTIYDGLGRVKQASNPYRPLQGETDIYTTTTFDLAGRVLTVTTPDSAVVTTGYSGNSVTVTDQDGKSRQSMTDGLGRLIQIYEDPNGPNPLNYLTSYSYDVLDSLTTVSQGSQTRTFVYDSLKRLTSATNPESGTIGYLYDDNGNLTQKTDARGIVSTYVYDALNRNTTVNYSDTAINPDLTRIYDTAANGIGRLRESYAGGNETSGSTVEHTKIISYDALGRPLDQRQRFKTNSVWSVEYQTQRSYDLAGHVKTQSYPSGHAVTYNYDAAGRLGDKDAQNLAFTGTLGDGAPKTYASELVYSPFGSLTKEKFGTDTPLYNKSFYNSRGQLAEIRVGTFHATDNTWWNRGAIINFYSSCWGMCGGHNSSTPMPGNNGNLKRQEVYIPGNDQITTSTTWAQQYDYDALNRLQRVHEYTSSTPADWQQEYVYDRYGNRTVHQTNTWGPASAPPINKKNFTVNTANNRLGVPGGQSGTMTYDAAGNLTVDTYSGTAVSRAYDAKNRMTSETQAGSVVVGTYTYNADGQRVRRKVGSVETWQVYGLDGELLAEYTANAAPATPQKEYGYRNGQLLITATAGVSNSALVGYWKFDENTGTTAADSSGNGNTGTLISSAGWASGHSGAAVNLNGVSGFVKIKDGKISTATSGTISGWVKINTLANGTKIVGYGGSAAANVQAVFGLELRQQGSNYYFSVIDVPADGTWAADSARGSTVVQTGVWYHLALTSDGSSWKLYVNGVAETMTNQLGNGNTGKWFGNTTAASPDKTAIGGCRFNGVDYPGINGLIDEVRVYDRALTVGEIATLASSGSGTSEVNWLVTDHLGTPRMIFDKTGNLAGVKRHDYLPFGEELTANQGSRTSTLGYNAADGVRQKFTAKERDIETGLDYFEARYFSSAQGRFTSVDPVFFQKEMLIDPQRYNQYSYVRNNPLKFVDPKGEAIELMGDEEHRRRTLEQLRKAVGKEAGAYLYENKGKDGKYYVGIYTNGPDGKGKAFGEINSLAQGIGAIIGDSRVARVDFVSDGTKVQGYRANEKVTITAQDTHWVDPQAGITFASGYGETTTYFLDPNAKYPHIPGLLMEDYKGAWDVAASDVLAHEMGEVAAEWGLIVGDANHISVAFENEARRLRDPSAKLRTGHSAPNDARSNNWKLGIKIP